MFRCTCGSVVTPHRARLIRHDDWDALMDKIDHLFARSSEDKETVSEEFELFTSKVVHDLFQCPNCGRLFFDFPKPVGLTGFVPEDSSVPKDLFRAR